MQFGLVVGIRIRRRRLDKRTGSAHVPPTQSRKRDFFMSRKKRTVGDRIAAITGEPAPADDTSKPDLVLPFERPWDKPIVAGFLGVTTSGLDKLVKEGKAPPFFRVGRMLRWRPSVVRGWALAQEAEATRINSAKAKTIAEATN